MYVCLCNAIRESELEELARSGIHDAGTAYCALGVEQSCETCNEYVQAILDQALAEQTVA